MQVPLFIHQSGSQHNQIASFQLNHLLKGAVSKYMDSKVLEVSAFYVFYTSYKEMCTDYYKSILLWG